MVVLRSIINNFLCVRDAKLSNRKIKSRKTIVDGIEFDSQTEADFYKHLMSRDDVKDIELQPKFTLVDEFLIDCGRCDEGKVPSPKTGNPINCRTCRGTGKRTRQSWTYTADFRIIWEDGHEDIVDVKGWANERFNLVRKMFEYKHKKELLVVKRQKNGWRYT